MGTKNKSDRDNVSELLSLMKKTGFAYFSYGKDASTVERRINLMAYMNDNDVFEESSREGIADTLLANDSTGNVSVKEAVLRQLKSTEKEDLLAKQVIEALDSGYFYVDARTDHSYADIFKRKDVQEALQRSRKKYKNSDRFYSLFRKYSIGTIGLSILSVFVIGSVCLSLGIMGFLESLIIEGK